MTRPITVLAASSLLGALAAQSVPHVTAVPKVCTGTWGTGSNLLPLARSGGMIQYWWRGDNFYVGQLVTAVGVRPSLSLSSIAQNLAKLEIKLSATATTYFTFSNVFANNLGANATTVFTAKPVSLPAVTAASDPNVPVIWLTADNPYLHLGGAMVGQFDLGTAVGAVQLTHVANAIASASWNATSGVSCGGTLSATSSGASYSVTLSGADANAAGSMLIGIDHTRLGGALPLPYKLDAFGLVGCYLGVDPLANLGFTATGTGGYSLTIPLPFTPSNPLILYAQALHKYAANPSGYATTNVTHSVIGAAGLANYVYNFTADGPVAQYGPYTTDRGAVILFKP